MHQNSDTLMERVLWYLFAGTRGGETRAKIVQSLNKKPRNPNQLADDIGLDYNTVQYHLEKLEEHNIVEQEQEGYGALYFFTKQFKENDGKFIDVLRTEDLLDEEHKTIQQRGVGQ